MKRTNERPRTRTENKQTNSWETKINLRNTVEKNQWKFHLLRKKDQKLVEGILFLIKLNSMILSIVPECYSTVIGESVQLF